MAPEHDSRGDRSSAAGSVPVGVAGGDAVTDVDATLADRLSVRARFVGDAVGWILGAALVLLLGVVAVAGYRLVAHRETVAAPLPELSAEAAAWLAGQKEVAVYSNGKVHLYGRVRDDTERQAMIDLATRALGPENVVSDEYYVDPTAPARTGPTTMRVADPVLFEFNSATIAAGFEPVLQFVATVMQQNPTVAITVIGHTDDIGDANENLRLSQQRAQAGVAAIVARGGDPGRLSGEGMGETAPIAANDTETGRQMNRRVEFVMTGL